MVYLADSLALATLETLVHLQIEVATEPYVASEFEVPPELMDHVGDLKTGWQSDLAYTRALGNDWLAAGTGAVLRVPSAIIPVGFNLFLNPAHGAADHVLELRRVRFSWDTRLL